MARLSLFGAVLRSCARRSVIFLTRRKTDRHVNWNSHRVTTILENALAEDKATSDATTYACIDVHQRATAMVLAKQECIISWPGAIARVLAVFGKPAGYVGAA